MTTQEKIEVMKAYADGKKIQWKTCGCQKWVEWTKNDEPCWNWLSNEYRIKPEEKYRPYKDTEEMIEDFRKKVGMGYPKLFLPSIWIKRKVNGERRLITGILRTTTICCDGCVPFNVDGLFQDYTYLDGSPCGMKED